MRGIKHVFYALTSGGPGVCVCGGGGGGGGLQSQWV